MSHAGFIRHTLSAFAGGLSGAAAEALEREFLNCELRTVVRGWCKVFPFVCAGLRWPVFPSSTLLDCEEGCMCSRCMCAARHGRCARCLLACKAHSHGRSARLHLNLSTGEERTIIVHRRSWLTLPRLLRGCCHASSRSAQRNACVHVATAPICRDAALASMEGLVRRF